VNPRGFRSALVDAFLPTESCQQRAEATEQQKRSDEHEPCPHSPNTACLPLTGQWRNGTTKSDPITVPSYSLFCSLRFILHSKQISVSLSNDSPVVEFERHCKMGHQLVGTELRFKRRGQHLNPLLQHGTVTVRYLALYQILPLVWPSFLRSTARE